MNTKNLKIPVWFWALSVIILLWNIMGVMSFFMHTMVSEETLQSLPTNERELYGKFPLWTKIVFAIAVFGGLLGSISLLLRKKSAKALFILSLIAVIIQMYHNLFMTNSIEVYGQEAWVMPIMVVLFGILSVWFTTYCTKRDLLN